MEDTIDSHHLPLPDQIGEGSGEGTSTATTAASFRKEENEQTGSGLLNDLSQLTGINSHHVLEAIAQFVLKKIKDSVPAPFQNYNLGPPAEVSTANPDIRPQNSFAISHPKDDLNDKFDEINLLKTIQPKFRRLGQILLKEFDKRPQDITWTPDGTLILDQISIPNSNIYSIFPLLFKAFVRSNSPPGLRELSTKINEIGLAHLIRCKLSKPKGSTANQSFRESGKQEKKPPTEKWWYLG